MNILIDHIAHLVILGIAFISLVLPHLRAGIFSRGLSEWSLDIVSLLNHFFIIKLFQVYIIYNLLSILVPTVENSITLGLPSSLALNLLIDYAWYWNHRLLHSRTILWNFHMVHHAANHLDVLASARNSFWSPLLMVYMWSFSLILFITKNPTNFLLIASFGLIINFWGHTSFNLKKNSLLNRIVSQIFITPIDHFWHHSTENTYCNFGTFFNFWDRMHGTFHAPGQLPKGLGFPIKMKTWKQLFFPFD